MAAKALLVAAQGQDKLNKWLQDLQLGEVVTVSGAAEARRISAGDMYTLAMINAPLADETGLELAIDIAKRTTAAVILLVKTELAPMINDIATEAGVLIVTKPVNQLLFEQTVKVGNVAETSIKEVWNSRYFTDLIRDYVRGDYSRLGICAKCSS